MRLNRVLAGGAVVTALALNGCLYHTQDLDSAKAPSDPFAAALFEGYKAQAKREAAGSESSASRFGQMALDLAAGGKPTEPVQVTNQKLSADDKAAATAGRELLMAAFGRQGVAKAPDQMGRAQSGFDCWVEEMEDSANGHSNARDLATCRTQFWDGLARAEAALGQ